MQVWARRLAGRLGDESGAALVEFALVAPALLMLIVAVFEFGDLYRRYQVLTDTAREGARYAAVTPLTADRAADSLAAATIVRNRLSAQGITPDSVTVRGLRAGGGQPVDVRIVYRRPINLGGFMPVSVPPVKLASFSRMRIE